MTDFKKGDRVRLNDKYMDARDHVGEVLTVVETAVIGGQPCIFTDPSLGGAYAADGFELVASEEDQRVGGKDAVPRERYERLKQVAKEAWECLDSISKLDRGLFNVGGYAKTCADETRARLAVLGVDLYE